MVGEEGNAPSSYAYQACILAFELLPIIWRAWRGLNPRRWLKRPLLIPLSYRPLLKKGFSPLSYPNIEYTRVYCLVFAPVIVNVLKETTRAVVICLVDIFTAIFLLYTFVHKAQVT